MNTLCTGKCRSLVTAVTIGGANSVLSCTNLFTSRSSPPMSLKSIIASIWKCLFSRGARQQHLTVEECVITQRLRELMDVTAQVSPTLPGGEGAERAIQAGDA